jgi:hypothetical protein
LLLSTFVAAAADPDAHSRDLNTDPRLSVLWRTFLVVLAPWLMGTVLLNNHGRSVMRTLLVMFAPWLMRPVLNNYDRLIMMLFATIAVLVAKHPDAQ